MTDSIRLGGLRMDYVWLLGRSWLVENSWLLGANCLGALAGMLIVPLPSQALEFVSLPVGVVPDPANSQQVLLQQGRERGVRQGDRGRIIMQGFTVVEGTDFKPMELPFTIISVSDSSAIASLPFPISGYHPIAADVTIRSFDAGDFFEVPTLESTAADSADLPSSDPAGVEADMANPDAFLSRYSNSERLCGSDVAAALLEVPPNHCIRLSREDRLVQAIVSGQAPDNVTVADAIGIAALYQDDARLREVVRLSFLQPDSARTHVAIGQEYLRFHHYQQALTWLSELPTDVTPFLQSAAFHSQMYAAYQLGEYEMTVLLGDRLTDLTSDRQNLIAAAHYQLGNVDQAVEILADLPPLDSIRNNYAIALYEQKQAALNTCLAIDDPDDCNATLIGELERQQQSRDLLENVATPFPNQRHNLAVLDVHRGELANAMDEFLTLNQEIATDQDFVPHITQLKDSLLQYIENHQASMEFLEEASLETGTGIPGFADDAAAIAGQLAGIGSFLPVALFNVIALASVEEQQATIIEFLNQELTSYYATDLEMVPIVRPPDLVGTSPYS